MKGVAIKSKPPATNRPQAIRNAFERLEVRMAVAKKQITIPISRPRWASAGNTNPNAPMKAVTIKIKPAAADRRQPTRNAFGRLEVMVVNAAFKGPNVRIAVAEKQITIPAMASSWLNGQYRTAIIAVTVRTKPATTKRPQAIHNAFERLDVIVAHAA